MNITNTPTAGVIRELLKQAPSAGQILHGLYGIDFTAPLYAAKIEGKFTPAAIAKAVQAAGINPHKARIACLDTSPEPYRANSLHLTEIHADGGFSVELPKRLWKVNKRDDRNDALRIDTYCRKADFNEYRKRDGVTAYIIAQADERRTPEKAATVDRTARFKYVKHDTHRGKDGTVYVTTVYTRRTDDTGSAYSINEHGNYYRVSDLEKYRELTEIIDKSGYITQDHRDELRSRARALRAEREKAAYLQNDHTAEVKALRAETEAVRDILADTLRKTAGTYDAIGTIAKRIDSLKWRFFELERIEERTATATYSSEAAFKKAADELQEALATT